MILCYAILEGDCLSSVVTQIWKEMEDRVLGFGDSVKTLTPTVCRAPCSAAHIAPAASSSALSCQVPPPGRD